VSQAFDVVVIGAGLGGMLAASILARRGRRVLLLEREPHVGGRLRSYEVDGFVIDAGAYLWPNLHLDVALREAGVTEFRASQIPLTQVLRVFVAGTAGRRFPFPWPGLPPSASLIEAAREALRADAETFQALHALWEKLAALPDETVQSLKHVPVRDGLRDYTRDPRVTEAFRRNVMLFGSYDPGSASMAECIGLRRRRMDAQAAKPECPGANPAGGVRALPNAVAKAMQEHGVELQLGCAVDRIVIDGRRARGVYAHGAAPFDELIEAAAVICNAPIWTLFDLVSPRHFPANFADSVQRFRVVGGTVNSAFVFRRLPRLRETGEPDQFPGWTRLLLGEQRSFGGGMLWTTLHSPHNAPPGCHILQAMRVSPHSDVADDGRVRAISNGFRAMLDEIYSDVDDSLMWSKSWTTRDGTEYMITAAPKPPVKSPDVEGLYFVGETTDVPAIQMDAAALSALRCAEMIGAECGVQSAKG
jgi:prolycopene isomerase